MARRAVVQGQLWESLDFRTTVAMNLSELEHAVDLAKIAVMEGEEAAKASGEIGPGPDYTFPEELHTTIVNIMPFIVRLARTRFAGNEFVQMMDPESDQVIAANTLRHAYRLLAALLGGIEGKTAKQLVFLPMILPETQALMKMLFLADDRANYFFEHTGAVLPGAEPAGPASGLWVRIPPGGASCHFVSCINTFGACGGFEAVFAQLALHKKRINAGYSLTSGQNTVFCRGLMIMIHCLRVPKYCLTDQMLREAVTEVAHFVDRATLLRMRIMFDIDGVGDSVAHHVGMSMGDLFKLRGNMSAREEPFVDELTPIMTENTQKLKETLRWVQHMFSQWRSCKVIVSTWAAARKKAFPAPSHELKVVKKLKNPVVARVLDLCFGVATVRCPCGHTSPQYAVACGSCGERLTGGLHDEYIEETTIEPAGQPIGLVRVPPIVAEADTLVVAHDPVVAADPPAAAADLGDFVAIPQGLVHALSPEAIAALDGPALFNVGTADGAPPPPPAPGV